MCRGCRRRRRWLSWSWTWISECGSGVCYRRAAVSCSLFVDLDSQESTILATAVTWILLYKSLCLFRSLSQSKLLPLTPLSMFNEQLWGSVVKEMHFTQWIWVWFCCHAYELLVASGRVPDQNCCLAVEKGLLLHAGMFELWMGSAWQEIGLFYV